MTLRPRYAALSDVGLHRQSNEDSYVAAPPLFVVCDGMGGAEAGEVASALAAETLAERFAAGEPLLAAAQAANDAVFARAAERLEEAGMGTTLTAVVVDGDTAAFAHVGDSRAYLLRDGDLRQLTDDHSLVGEMVREGSLTKEEAAVHPHRSILSRALGTDTAIAIDEFSETLHAGDVLLLCSDGLSGEVPDDALRDLLAVSDPAEAARGLVAAARSAGGHDNITAVVIKLESGDADGADETGIETVVLAAGAGAVGREGRGDQPGGEGEETADGDAGDDPSTGDDPGPPDGEAAGVATPATPAAAPRRRRLLVLVVVLALVALLGVAGVVVVNTCYFVGVDDGQLAVYSGLPWALGPLELNSVYLRSSQPYVLLDATQRDLVDARRVQTKGGAMQLAEDLGMLP